MVIPRTKRALYRGQRSGFSILNFKKSTSEVSAGELGCFGKLSFERSGNFSDLSRIRVMAAVSLASPYIESKCAKPPLMSNSRTASPK